MLAVQMMIREAVQEHGYHEAWDIALDTYLDTCAANSVERDEQLADLINREVRTALVLATFPIAS